MSEATLPYWDREYDIAWILQYWFSSNAEHRAFLLEEMAQVWPFGSLLEVGCHCGPNLALLHGAEPDVKLTGIDPCATAIEFGRQRTELDGVTLRVGTIGPDTSDWPDRAFDVVLSCYALAYVQPEELPGALAECWRLTNKGLVIYEPMTFDGRTGKRRVEGNPPLVEYWHPYISALATVPGCSGLSAAVTECKWRTNHLNGLLILKRPS